MYSVPCVYCANSNARTESRRKIDEEATVSSYVTQLRLVHGKFICKMHDGDRQKIIMHLMHDLGALFHRVSVQ